MTRLPRRQGPPFPLPPGGEGQGEGGSGPRPGTSRLPFALLLALTLWGSAAGASSAVRLADFEGGVPAPTSTAAGFHPRANELAAALSGGARGTAKFGRFFLTPYSRSAYFQYGLRRRYLATGTSLYRPRAVNALSFWVRVGQGSHLLCDEPAGRLGVWTYHWRSDDLFMGGANGTSGTTDSMMHGYANLCLDRAAAGRWVRVELSESAFKQQRDYYHFYAARGVTGDLEFFPSLRQLQFVLLGSFEGVAQVDLDELELLRRPPTAAFEPEYAALAASVAAGDLPVPVVLRNPTGRDRRYRVFASSALGASREFLNRVFGESDDIHAITAVQKGVGGGGGVGAAELRDAEGADVIGGAREIAIPAGGQWRGTLVHRLRPEMRGELRTVSHNERSWQARRDTLTTSLIAWDPAEPPGEGMAWVRAPSSNADAARHTPPPGFPPQTRPPESWRSEDVPLGQVGAYLVTEIRLDP